MMRAQPRRPRLHRPPHRRARACGRARMPGRCRRAASIQGEDPWPAALRELYEETNIRSVERLGEIDGMAQLRHSARDRRARPGRASIAARRRNGMRCASPATRARSTSPIRPAATSRNSSHGAGSRCTSCRSWSCRSSAPVYERVVKEFARFAKRERRAGCIDSCDCASDQRAAPTLPRTCAARPAGP